MFRLNSIRREKNINFLFCRIIKILKIYRKLLNERIQIERQMRLRWFYRIIFFTLINIAITSARLARIMLYD